MSSRIPALDWLPDYRSRNLAKDALAAAVVTALMVPQSLGYASIAGVPVQVGLYAIPAALVTYGFLGTSPQLVVGPVSTVSVVSGSIVALAAGGDVGRAVAVTSALAIISGLLLVVAGLLRVGWVAEFLSKPIISGFVFGLSIVIVMGEIPTLLGMPPVSGSAIERFAQTVAGLGSVHPTTAIIGATSLAILFVGGARLKVAPWGLLLVVAGLALSRWVDLAARGVAIVGDVPGGLPAPSIPDIPLSHITGLVFSGAGLALVGLAESLSAARLFAAQGHYRIDADQEFIATGASNVLAGLFGGLGVAGSLSKTAAAARSGGVSQVTGLVSAAFVVVVLVFFASSLSNLPRAVLSAVVIHAVWGLMDVKAIVRYAGVRRNDFVAAVAALLGVLVLGTLYGLLAAIALSVLGLVYRSGRLEVDVMGKVHGEKAAWGSVRRHPDRKTIEGILVLRLSAPLFWVNAAIAEELVMQEVDAAPLTRVVILDLEATHQLDTTSADALANLIRELRARGVDLYLVRVMHLVRGVLRRAGLMDQLGPDHIWHSISQGVRAARRLEELTPGTAGGASGTEEEHIAATDDAHEDGDGAPGRRLRISRPTVREAEIGRVGGPSRYRRRITAHLGGTRARRRTHRRAGESPRRDRSRAPSGVPGDERRGCRMAAVVCRVSRTTHRRAPRHGADAVAPRPVPAQRRRRPPIRRHGRAMAPVLCGLPARPRREPDGDERRTRGELVPLTPFVAPDPASCVSPVVSWQAAHRAMPHRRSPPRG